MSGCRNLFLVISLFSLSRKSETPTKWTRFLKQEVRADFAKTKSLITKCTHVIFIDARKKTLCLHPFCKDHLRTTPKPNKLHERPAGNVYASSSVKVHKNFNPFCLVKIGKHSDKTPSRPLRSLNTRHCTKQ